MLIELLLRSARAIAISCLWPWEKFDPPAATKVSNDTVTLASTSVDVAEMIDSEVDDSCVTLTADGVRDNWREAGTLLTIWTRCRTSKHSPSSCSSNERWKLGGVHESEQDSCVTHGTGQGYLAVFRRKG